MAKLALGNDVTAAAGLLRDVDWARRCDAQHSGKLVCLERLLALWAKDSSNKVWILLPGAPFSRGDCSHRESC